MQNLIEKLYSEFEMVDVVTVCQKLVQINSINPPGNERDVASFCFNFLQDLGFEVNLLDHSDRRASVLACLRGSGEAGGVMICSHMDTVPLGSAPWKHNPLDGEISEGKIWGRGASDMKGGLAASLAAVKALILSGIHLKGNLWMALTAGEEVDFLGALEVVNHKEVLPLQALIIPEPSSNNIYLAQKGALWLELTFHGKTAHGSMPNQGVNAVEWMAEFVHRFRSVEFPFPSHPLLDHPTATVTMINGGIKINVVPDECKANIDIRTIPGQDHNSILEKINEMLQSLEMAAPGLKTSMTILNNRPAVSTEISNPVVQPFKQAVYKVYGREVSIGGVNYFTDSAILSPGLDLPMIICGPGHAYLAHQTDEFVSIDLLQEAVKIYALALLNYIG